MIRIFKIALLFGIIVLAFSCHNSNKTKPKALTLQDSLKTFLKIKAERVELNRNDSLFQIQVSVYNSRFILSQVFNGLEWDNQPLFVLKKSSKTD